MRIRKNRHLKCNENDLDLGSDFCIYFSDLSEIFFKHNLARRICVAFLVSRSGDVDHEWNSPVAFFFLEYVIFHAYRVFHSDDILDVADLPFHFDRLRHQNRLEISRAQSTGHRRMSTAR